ncbi:MAG: ABC transporter ATP-binding protein [Candidatus Geothermarchaeales archaeon]
MAPSQGGRDVTLPVVQTIEVSKNFGFFPALKNISFEVRAGESLAVLGPNGSGKSTLLKIVAAHMRPSSGQVRVFGLNPVRNVRDIKRGVGYVAHGSFLYDELTVEENLRFYQKMFSANTRGRGFEGLLELLRLKGWMKTPVGSLSHGLRKRADIARALVHEPDLFLLDEPFSGLDEESRGVLIDYFSDRCGGATLLLSSHNVALARRVCHRGVFLDRGMVVRDVGF